MIIKQVPILTLFTFLFLLAVISQTLIAGSVTNKRGEPLPANVTVQAKNEVSLAGFTATDAKGYYSLGYLKHLSDIWFLRKTNFAIFSFCREYLLVCKSRNPTC